MEENSIISDFKIDDDCVKFYIERKRGRGKGIYECLIDYDDWIKIKDMIWNVVYRKTRQNSDDYYVLHNEYIGMKNGHSNYNSILLHRFITGAKEDNIIDHINHNTLDNRKCNLRISEQNENLKHRNGKNQNNKSGYRNVFWDNNQCVWKVTLCDNYKTIYIGTFNDVHEAGKAAEEARQKYYGEFKGIS
jgi:hypothetical protein